MVLAQLDIHRLKTAAKQKLKNPYPIQLKMGLGFKYKI